MQTSNYPYSLEKHPKKKGTCPNCGHNNVFRFYEDLEGNRLEGAGICDRQNSCGEHIKPTGVKVVTGKVFEPKPQPVQIYPTGGQLKELDQVGNRFETNLHTFLTTTLGISAEHFKKWGVGTRGDKTVFIFRNRENRIVNAKTMLYKADGHRDKDFIAKSFAQPKDELQRYMLCLFGEHLLDTEKAKTVFVVESEKTALIASFFFRQFDWVSCAANTGLTDAKMPALFGRHIIWLCDADKAGRPGKSNSSIRKLQAYNSNFSVVDLFQDREDGYDLADYIIDQKGVDLLNLENAIKSMTIDPNQYPAEPQKPEMAEKASSEQKHSTKNIVKNKGLIANSEDKKPKKSKEKTDDDYSFTVWYTKPGGMRIKAGKYFDEVAPNFQVFIKYKTEDEQENVTWVLEIRKNDDTSIFIEVLHDDFCSARKLKNILATKQLGFKIADGHLAELHSYLFTETTFSTAMKVLRYGYHPDSEVYFFANKALNVRTGEMLTPDQFGIVEANNLHLSIPQQTKIRQQRYTLTDQKVDFSHFWKLYATAHLRENAFLPVCFYIFSLFRDLGLQYKNFSPILFLKGGAGTGKSSMIRILTAAFGRKQEGVNLKSKNTDSALVKLMGQTSNSIIWFDEFHNELTNEGLLQAAYDNDGYHKSTADFNSIDTATVDIHSALALTSNYLPENPIFFSRCLFVPITAQDKTEEQRAAFYELEDIQEGGLGQITVDLLKHRVLLKSSDNYGTAYNKLYSGLKSRFKGQSVPERLFANMSQIMAAPLVFQNNGKINLLEIETADEKEILEEYLEMGETFILRQWRIMNESTAGSEFFEILQLLYEGHQIHEGLHFNFERDEIHLSFRKLYNLFAQKYRQVYYKSPPDRETIRTELATIAGASDYNAISKSIRFDNDFSGKSQAKTVPETGSCSLNYKVLQQNFAVDLLNRSAPGI